MAASPSRTRSEHGQRREAVARAPSAAASKEQHRVEGREAVSLGRILPVAVKPRDAGGRSKLAVTDGWGASVTAGEGLLHAKGGHEDIPVLS